MTYIRMGALLLIVFACGLQGQAYAILPESEPPPTCAAGESIDSASGSCKASDAGSSDTEIMAQARRLMDEERFAEARAFLDQVKQQNSARYLNYLGFVTRKLGDPQAALVHYRRALILDPHYAEAREYLGEAYLMLGRVADAEAELAAIARLCGKHCEPYQELAEAIRLAKSR